MCCSLLFYVVLCCFMYCVLIHAVFFPPYIEFSHIYCASLHVLFFLYILCAASCLTLNSMYCVLCHALCLTPCPVCCVMPCAWPHACMLCHALCLTPCPCAVLCHGLCLTPCPCAIPYIPFFFMHAKSHFGHISGFFKWYIQNFFDLRIDIHIFLFFWI